MPLNPMKKNPKVPTISASSLLPIDGASMSFLLRSSSSFARWWSMHRT